MSDEFLREVEEDLEKEKALLFLKKYGVALGLGAAIILGGVAYYSWQKDQNESRYQTQADNFYTESRKVLKDAKKSPDLKAVDDIYKGLLTQIRANIFVTKDDNTDIAQKIIADFTKDHPFETGAHKDNFANSLLHLNDLSYKSETLDLKSLETEVKNYARINGAFKAFAYEILIARAILDNDFKIASYYHDLLTKDGYDPAIAERLKVYGSYLPQDKDKTSDLVKDGE